MLDLKDPSGDGDGLITEALKRDEYFFMGYIYIATQLAFAMDATDKHDQSIADLMSKCTHLKTTRGLKLQPHETLYFRALECLFGGRLKCALSLWRQIIALNSFDVLALWFLHFGYQSYGQTRGLLDSIACVVSDFERRKPVTLPHIHAMYAFALEENGDYVRAWKYVNAALDEQPSSVWATHAKVHILQEVGQPKAAIAFLRDHAPHWRHACRYDSVSGIHHIEWHWGLAYIETGQYREALSLFDASYLNRQRSALNATVRLRDAASYLWRLELNRWDFDGDGDGAQLYQDIQQRWRLCGTFIQPEMNQRFVEVYHDAYYLMNLIKNERGDLAQQYVQRLKRQSRQHVARGSGNTYMVETCPNAAIACFESLYDGYVAHEYGTAFDRLYDVVVANDANWRMAGSRAQKDIFPLTLIDLGFRAQRWGSVKTLLHARLENRILCPNTLNWLQRLYGKNSVYHKMRLKALDGDGYRKSERPFHWASMNDYVATFSTDYISKM